MCWESVYQIATQEQIQGSESTPDIVEKIGQTNWNEEREIGGNSAVSCFCKFYSDSWTKNNGFTGVQKCAFFFWICGSSKCTWTKKGELRCFFFGVWVLEVLTRTVYILVWKSAPFFVLFQFWKYSDVRLILLFLNNCRVVGEVTWRVFSKRGVVCNPQMK